MKNPPQNKSVLLSSSPWNYDRQVRRSLSPGFYPDNDSPDYWITAIKGAISAAAMLDKFKKSLFYNKPSGFTRGVHYTLSPDQIPEIKNLDKGSIDLLHAAIGLVTEAGELLEAVYFDRLIGKEDNLVNLTEELGDLEWYLSLARTALSPDLTQDIVQRINIAKLRKRYPEKFDQTLAVNRDLGTEYDTLREEVAKLLKSDD